MSYQCSGYTRGVQCANEVPNLWNDVIALCPSHYAKHARVVLGLKEKAIAAHQAKIHAHRDELAAVRKAQPTYVYFFLSGQKIKIGYSRNPKFRLAQVKKRTSGALMPRGLDISKVRMLAAIPGGRPEEQALHVKFAHLRDVGEWFRAAPELLDYIETAKAEAA